MVYQISISAALFVLTFDYTAVTASPTVILPQSHAHGPIPHRSLTSLRRQDSSSTKHAHITWISPTAASMFAPGANFDVRWTVDGGRELVSPSFQLCIKAKSVSKRKKDKGDSDDKGDSEDDDEDEWEDDKDDNAHQTAGAGASTTSNSGGQNCGASIWPTVQHSDSSDSVQLALPSGGDSGEWYIMVEDNFGTKTRSPLFTVSTGGTKGTDSNATTTQTDPGQAGAGAGAAQAPMNAAPSQSVSTSTPGAAASAAPPASPSSWTSDPVTSASSASTPILKGKGKGIPDPVPSAAAAPPASGVNPSAPLSPPPVVNPGSAPTQLPPNLMATRSSPPVAAFAVPLSLVAAILLLAGIASFRHSKREKVERDGLAAKGTASEEKKGAVDLERDVERIVERRERERGGVYPFGGFGGAMPVPVFMAPGGGMDPRYLAQDDGYTRHQRRYEPRRQRGYGEEGDSVTQDVLSSYMADVDDYPRCLRPADVHVRHPAPGRGRRMDTSSLFGEVEGRLRG